jgi:hypothetical protein
MARQRVTVLELCAARAGGRWTDLRVAAKVAGFIVAWAIASRARGGPVTVDGGFVEYWGTGYSRRTAFRHLSLFRGLFPDEKDPQRIADLLLAATAGEPSPLTVVAA